MMFLTNSHLSYNLNAQHHIRTSPTKVTITNQINPILTLPTCLRSISITAYHLQPGLSSGPFTSGLNQNVLTFVIFRMCHVISHLIDTNICSSHAVFTNLCFISLLRSNILSVPSSNILNLYTSSYATDL
jgi:hypothetical protein